MFVKSIIESGLQTGSEISSDNYTNTQKVSYK
jgi:hypothetical protein